MGSIVQGALPPAAKSGVASTLSSAEGFSTARTSPGALCTLTTVDRKLMEVELFVVEK